VDFLGLDDALLATYGVGQVLARSA